MRKKRLRIQSLFTQFLHNRTRVDFFPELNNKITPQNLNFAAAFAINYRGFDHRLLQNRFILVSGGGKTLLNRWQLLLIIVTGCAVITVIALFLQISQIYTELQVITGLELLKVREFFIDAQYNYSEFLLDLGVSQTLVVFFRDFFERAQYLTGSIIYFLSYAWEIWVDIAGAKYLIERPLFEIL